MCISETAATSVMYLGICNYTGKRFTRWYGKKTRAFIDLLPTGTVLISTTRYMYN